MTQGESGRESDWDGVRLHVVTGKGGTGKTTVAAALAIALADRGETVLLCEVEGRQGLSRLFDVPTLPYDETRLVALPDEPGDRGREPGVVYGLAIDPEAALLEYLELYYHLGRAGRMLDKIGAIDFATTIAPGVRDVLLTGKVYEAVGRRSKDARRVKGRPTYDTVVLDAPPTGRIARFLGVNAGVVDIARVGPIRNQADSIMKMMQSPRTAVHLVTVLEPMPVQETADGIDELRAAGIPVGGIVVNLTERTPFSGAGLRRVADGKLGADAICAGLASTGLRGLTDLPDLASQLAAEAREHVRHVEAEQAERVRLTELRRPTYDLPALVDGIDLGALFELARSLRDQGMA